MGEEPGEVVRGDFATDASSDSPERVELRCQEVSGAEQRREDRLNRLAEPAELGCLDARLALVVFGLRVDLATGVALTTDDERCGVRE